MRDGNNKSLLKAATIRLDATPKEMWKKSNFPEKITQKKNMIRNVSAKGARAVRILVGLREILSIYQRFPVPKSCQSNLRDPAGDKNPW